MGTCRKKASHQIKPLLYKRILLRASPHVPPPMPLTFCSIYVAAYRLTPGSHSGMPLPRPGAISCSVPGLPGLPSSTWRPRDPRQPMSVLQVPPAMAGHLSTVLSCCRVGKAQLSRDNSFPHFIPCGACTGLYKAAQVSANDEAKEADA